MNFPKKNTTLIIAIHQHMHHFYYLKNYKFFSYILSKSTEQKKQSKKMVDETLARIRIFLRQFMLHKFTKKIIRQIKLKFHMRI